MPVFFHSTAQALNEGLAPSVTQEQINSAMKELSAATGQPVTTQEQAKAVCDQEKYFESCAGIGKKYGLYKADEVKQVDSLLSELKGRLTEDIKKCNDTQCLINVANQLAKKVTAKDPTLATQLELTPDKLGQKQAFIQAAKEAGVNFKDCQNLDPDSATVDLLRACARLAKDARVERFIPEADKQRSDFDVDKTVALRTALASGKLACGDGTLEGCGQFCLNPPAGASAPGTAAIPSVCRQIAQQFFGSDGVKQLEQAHSQVGKVKEFYSTKLVLVTPDGKAVSGHDAIRNTCEQAFSSRDIALAKACGDFAVKNGFASQADVEDGLKVIQNFAQKGQNVNFDDCLKHPEQCQAFVPPEKQAEFKAGLQIQQVMTQEIGFDPQQCQNAAADPNIAKNCLEGSKRALAKIEALGSPSPLTQRIIREIRENVNRADQFQQRAGEFNQVFQQQGGPGGCKSGGECNAYCSDPAHGPECIAFGAKQGLSGFRGAEAVDKFREFNRNLQGPQFPQGLTGFPGQGPFPGFVPPGQGGLPPGQIPGFPGSQPGYGQGPNPECLAAIQSGDFVKAKAVCAVSTAPPIVPIEGGRVCPYYASFACPVGYYHKSFTNQDGCTIEGPCVPVEGSFSPPPGGSFPPYPSYSQPPDCTPPPGPAVACPSGQHYQPTRDARGCYSYASLCVPDANYSPSPGYSYTPYPSGSYPPPSTQCPSAFAHDMGGYCMLNTDSGKCSEYATAGSQANYTSTICQSHGTGPYPSGSYTPYPSGYTPTPGASYTPYPNCPAGQYWDNFAKACKVVVTPSYSYTPYPSGSYIPNPSYSYSPPPTSSQCPSSFAHDMGGYCMLNAGSGGCAEYSNASVQSNYTTATCGAHTSYSPYPSTSPYPTSSYTYSPYPTSGYTYTPYPTTSYSPAATAYPTGSYTPYPTVSYTPFPSNTYTPPPACSSGQYWNGTACVATQTYSPPPSTYSPPPASSYTPPPACPAGQHWSGTACVAGNFDTQKHNLAVARTQRLLASTIMSCADSGGQWDAAASSCQGGSSSFLASILDFFLDFFK